MLKVSEIFYSLQGEGARAGTANVFIRLQGCKAKHACAAMGVKCDTEFESGRPYSIGELLLAVSALAPACRSIIWTGGEPLDQLTAEHVALVKAAGYFQAIETSGLHPAVAGLDYVTVSPKVAEHIVAKNFPAGVDELRYVRHTGQCIPAPILTATNYFLSPHSDGFNLNPANLAHCVELVKQNPGWRLSLQMHKVWSVL